MKPTVQSIREEVQLLESIRKNPGDFSVIQKGITDKVINSDSRLRKLRELHTLIKKAGELYVPIIFSYKQKEWYIPGPSKDKSSYSTQAQEKSDNWKDHVRYKKSGNYSGLMFDNHVNSTTLNSPLYIINKDRKVIPVDKMQSTYTYGLEWEIIIDSKEAVRLGGETSINRGGIYYELIEALGGSDNVIVKGDSSLYSSRDREGVGVEVVTVPHTFVNIRQHFKNMFNSHKEMLNKLYANISCGIHIHVNKSSLSVSQLSNMYYFIHSKHNSDFITAVGGRETDHNYSRRFPDIIDNYGSRVKFATHHKTDLYKNFSNINQFGSGRNAIHASTSNPTIEFRLFNSTTDKQTILAYIEFVDALVNWASVSHAGDLTYNSLMRFIMDADRHPPSQDGIYRDISPRMEYINLVRHLVDKGFVEACQPKNINKNNTYNIQKFNWNPRGVGVPELVTPSIIVEDSNGQRTLGSTGQSVLDVIRELNRKLNNSPFRSS